MKEWAIAVIRTFLDYFPERDREKTFKRQDVAAQ
jgi:hypothetical protein